MCLKHISSPWGDNSVATIDMNEFRDARSACHFLPALQQVQTYPVIVFDNIGCAHKSVVTLADQVIRTRVANVVNLAAGASNIVAFPDTLFVVTYIPPPSCLTHSSNRLVSKAKQTFAHMFSEGFPHLFDAYAPFRPLPTSVQELIFNSEGVEVSVPKPLQESDYASTGRHNRQLFPGNAGQFFYIPF